MHGLACEIRDEVRGTVQDLKQELRQAAREIRREQRHENRSRRDRHDDHHRWDWRDEGFDGRLAEFLDRTQRAMRRVQLTEAQVRGAAILDEAFERIRQTLKDTGERPQTTEERTSDPGAAIEARDLTKTYAKDVRALDGLGFQVEAGTVFGLLAALCATCTWLATRAFRSYQRSI